MTSSYHTLSLHLNCYQHAAALLLGWRRLLEVPQFEGVVLGGGDQDGLHWMKGQTPH